MPRRATTFALPLPARDPATPAFRWLCGALRAEILDGRLRPGARLPATRELAGQYALSRGTIVVAFEQLKAEGYLEAGVGSGTYVSRVLPDDLLQVAPRSAGGAAVPAPAGRPPRRQRRRRSAFARRLRPVPDYDPRPPRAFRTNQPALDLFPATLWAQVAARRLRRAPAGLFLGCGALGYGPLREAVADYLRTSRGVRCTAEQVVIVSGAQEALDLVARLCLDPGGGVCMEDPGYVGAARAFAACGARMTYLRVDAFGMKVPPARLHGIRLAYVTPAHQHPTGVSMSLPRRLALLAWARRSGALVLEDDYDGEYRYAGRPLPALQGLDRHGVVIFAGTFSKVLFPALRLGYLVVPEDLVASYAAAKSVTSRHAALLDQAVLCDFIAGGHFGAHLRRMREVYAERLGVLLDCAARRLAGLLELSDVEAGLETTGWLRRGLDAGAVAAAAARRGVEVGPLRLRGRGSLARGGLQMGFAAVDPREIRRGVEALAVAIEEVLSRSGGG